MIGPALPAARARNVSEPRLPIQVASHFRLDALGLEVVGCAVETG
jgi:hypothetical protein